MKCFSYDLSFFFIIWWLESRVQYYLDEVWHRWGFKIVRREQWIFGVIFGEVESEYWIKIKGTFDEGENDAPTVAKPRFYLRCDNR